MAVELLSSDQGKVVGIINRSNRLFVATLQEGESTDRYHLCIPLDYHIPKIRIHHHSPASLASQRIVVRFDSWDISSRYPSGHFVRTLGPIHHLDTEIKAIMVEHQLSRGLDKEFEFSAKAIEGLPNEQEFQVSLEGRRDLRNLLIFSIDPPGSQDIDDALSIELLENGELELGVHIADVTAFVAHGSVLDQEACRRGTTVYLADRRYNMLPEILSERLCSLRENSDRYAVSILFRFSSNFEIKTKWFGKTVIRSTKELSYALAQDILDGNDPMERQLCTSIRSRLRMLRDVVIHIRSKRQGLELASTEVKFDIGPDGHVNGIVAKETIQMNQMIEECMILANAHVAKILYDKDPAAALLRHHPAPYESKFEELKRLVKMKGIQLRYESASALARSIHQCEKLLVDSGCSDVAGIMRIIKLNATRAMSEAHYISAVNEGGEDIRHYGLNLDFYTHFTSPIRRYADVIVHRQLLSMENPIHLQELVDHLNIKNRSSKLAQRDSMELYQQLYVYQHVMCLSNTKTKNKDLFVEGIVTEITEVGFFVDIEK